MSEAVTMPSLIMMASIVSEESLVRDTQTDRQTDRLRVLYLELFREQARVKHEKELRKSTHQ